MDKQNHVDAQQHLSQTPSRQPGNPPEDKKLSPSVPNDGHPPQQKGLKGLVYLSPSVEERSNALMPLLGYSLLVFSLFDYIYIVIPPRFTDPAWELETIGALVEHIAVPLLGLMLVFYRHQGYMFKLEKKLLGFLSWFCLLMGLLYLLILPLGVADTWRLYHANKAQFSARFSQQRQQFQQVTAQLNQAKTDEQIKQLFTSLTPQIASKDIKNPQEFKDRFLAQITEGERRAQVQSNTAWANQSRKLLKNSVKWNLGALVSGTLLIWIWHLTNWTRKRKY